MPYLPLENAYRNKLTPNAKLYSDVWTLHFPRGYVVGPPCRHWVYFLYRILP